MTGIDTNVLVRYFVKDDIRQSAISKHLIQKQFTQTYPGYISSVVLVELLWVLTSIYGVGREDVITIIKSLLGEKRLVLEHENEVYFALGEYLAGSLDFSDALIAAIADSAGCSTTVTFDRKASRHHGFTLL